MGMPFAASLQQLLENIGNPLQDLLAPQTAVVDEEHQLLWDCYLSGQMSDASLEREIAADPEFAAFVRLKSGALH